MRIDVVAPLDLTAEDKSAWARLQAADSACESPFLSSHWVVACVQAGGPDLRAGRVAIARNSAGEAQAFLPLRVSGGAALPMGSPLADYQAMVSAPGLELDVRELIRGAGATRFDFNHLLECQTPFARHMRGTSESQVVDLSAGYAAYAAERRAGGHDILKDTAKKRRKLERERGKVEFTALSASTEDFDRLIAWKRQQYKATRQTDIFEAGWPLRLLKAMHARNDADFGGVLFTLHVDGVLAAAHFALRGGRVLHAWFIAHEADFAKYSPGVILIDHILQWGSDQGVRELDMGPGDYRFKMQLANTTRTVAHGFVGVSPPASLVREAQYRVRTAAESLPLGRVSAWPGKAMRRVDLWRGLR